MQNSNKVQSIYGFVAIKVLSFGEIYGEKICAALDRQHPRDLFDIKYLFENEGINNEVKQGFIISLLSHNRPPHAILKSRILNQEAIFTKEFKGMSEDYFLYNDHINVMHKLISDINSIFNEKDKNFLINFFMVEPKRDLLDIKIASKLPAIKWKMQNLKSLKTNNNEEFKFHSEELMKILNISRS